MKKYFYSEDSYESYSQSITDGMHLLNASEIDEDDLYNGFSIYYYPEL